MPVYLYQWSVSYYAELMSECLNLAAEISYELFIEHIYNKYFKPNIRMPIKLVEHKP